MRAKAACCAEAGRLSLLFIIHTHSLVIDDAMRSGLSRPSREEAWMREPGGGARGQHAEHAGDGVALVSALFRHCFPGAAGLCAARVMP